MLLFSKQSSRKKYIYLCIFKLFSTLNSVQKKLIFSDDTHRPELTFENTVSPSIFSHTFCWMRIWVYKMYKPKGGLIYVYGCMVMQKNSFLKSYHAVSFTTANTGTFGLIWWPWSYYLGCPPKYCVVGFQKWVFCITQNIHKHGLMPLLACTFYIYKAPFSRRMFIFKK